MLILSGHVESNLSGIILWPAYCFGWLLCCLRDVYWKISAYLWNTFLDIYYVLPFNNPVILIFRTRYQNSLNFVSDYVVNNIFGASKNIWTSGIGNAIYPLFLYKQIKTCERSIYPKFRNVSFFNFFPNWPIYVAEKLTKVH